MKTDEDRAIIDQSEEIFQRKIREYNESDRGNGHYSRYVRLSDKYVMLIAWKPGWGKTIYPMEEV